MQIRGAIEFHSRLLRIESGLRDLRRCNRCRSTICEGTALQVVRSRPPQPPTSAAQARGGRSIRGCGIQTTTILDLAAAVTIEPEPRELAGGVSGARFDSYVRYRRGRNRV